MLYSWTYFLFRIPFNFRFCLVQSFINILKSASPEFFALDTFTYQKIEKGDDDKAVEIHFYL